MKTLWERPALAAAVIQCAVLTTLLGAYLVVEPNAQVFISPGYANLKSIFPIKVWGALFLLKAIFAWVGVLRGSWSHVAYVATIGGGLWTCWAAVFFYTAFTNEWLGFVGALAFIGTASLHGLTAWAASLWVKQRG